MKRTVVLIITCLTFFTSSASYAWGHKGHSLVAEIAFHYLDATTKKNVLAYLNGMSIEDAANWMDSMRSDKQYDFMKPYHYVNIDRNTTVKELEGDNIINTLTKSLNDLDNMKGLSNEEIRMKLLYIFHLVGDLHQPLHVGYKDDKGGNTVQVSFLGRGTNLHALWDTDIIEYKGLDLNDELKMNTYSAADLAAIKKIDVIAWTKDSRSFLKNAYSLDNAKVSDYYIDSNYTIIQQQILKAGLRLASILEHYFKDVNVVANTQVKEIPPSSEVTDVVALSTDIDVTKAADYEGKLVRICSKVYSTKVLDSNGMTFLNVGGKYPSAPLTVVIYADKLKNFDFVPSTYYKGKTICITGTIKLYKGKPEIIINTPHAIEIK
ncbi:hypothetical protein EZL74_09450 [Flavobacterium silvisoli]|uniref:S1/P1 Nuclease n=1 Tax=Flavobacterium silvisoli TaxID=2529433 RepID=A0A4Q9YUV5_9FLAO|nr:S1/P1 nuclease [Flavobacterium silvisoli]TBX67487.1 hypothetical protein EZL74_09450 [Flavobacterium silvisoli]